VPATAYRFGSPGRPGGRVEIANRGCSRTGTKKRKKKNGISHERFLQVPSNPIAVSDGTRGPPLPCGVHGAWWPAAAAACALLKWRSSAAFFCRAAGMAPARALPECSASSASSLRERRPGGSFSGRARRQQRFWGAVSPCALMALGAAAILGGAYGSVLCPPRMYAPPESGQDTVNDCICSGGAVSRNFTAEDCTFYRLEEQGRACAQPGLDWYDLGPPEDSPAACMHQVLANLSGNCARQDFFLWKDSADGRCYCPGGSPAAIDQCSYSTFSVPLMGASTYRIENGAAGSSCFLTTESLCEPCPAGTYTDETDSIYDTEKCTPCPAGSYSPKVGANSSSQCIPCGAGWYSTSSGETSSATCVPCEAGKYSTFAISSRCISCPAGHYSERIGANSSDMCLQVLSHDTCRADTRMQMRTYVLITTSRTRMRFP